MAGKLTKSGRPRKPGSGMNSKAGWIKQGERRNPFGRPTQLPPPPDRFLSMFEDDQIAADPFLKALASKRTIVEGGKKKTVSNAELLSQVQINKALKGDPRALHDATREMERRRRDQAELDSKRFETLYEYKIGCHLKIMFAKSWGRPEPTFALQPDDIVLMADGRLLALQPGERERIHFGRQMAEFLVREIPELVRQLKACARKDRASIEARLKTSKITFARYRPYLEQKNTIVPEFEEQIQAAVQHRIEQADAARASGYIDKVRA